MHSFGLGDSNGCREPYGSWTTSQQLDIKKSGYHKSTYGTNQCSWDEEVMKERK